MSLLYLDYAAVKVRKRLYVTQICANAGGASRASRCKIAKAHEAPPWTGRLKDMRAAIGSS